MTYIYFEDASKVMLNNGVNMIAMQTPEKDLTDQDVTEN